MLFNAQTLALAALFSTLATGRPFESSKPRDVVPRDKSYSVVNVGGDSSTPGPATATSVVETTKTVEVVGPGETVTREVTATVLTTVAPATSCSSSSASKSSSSPTATPSSSTPAPTTTSAWSTSSPRIPSSTSISTPTISSLSSSSVSTAIETPKPIFVTVTVSKDEGPTEYYDDGMWHTFYRVKTFEGAAAATAAP